SNPLSLNVTPQNVEADTTGKLIVTVSNSDAPTVPLALDTGLTYVMVVAGNGYAEAATYTNNQWKFDSLPVDAAASYTVSLYVKCEGTLNAAATGFATGAGDVTSVFKFSIDVEQN
ncbi:MAG: hypothetical protein J5897_02700, partial [Candidatus Methanomethylophilus sp.]|nr:hypothetical protein [Methanomethylophilus sp.]